MKYQRKKNRLTKELKNKTVLITGGAGSVGTALTKQLLQYPVKVVRVLDIDEHALFKLGREVHDKRLRLLLGSILDKDRVEIASNNVDIIIHVAAIKNIEISEFNPLETIEVNINGTVNMIKAVMKTKPKKFLNISTDKATEPTTLYGSTKQLGEKLTSWAGNHIPETTFATVRFGNIIESRGNVFEIWDNEIENGKPLSLTNPLMKRYFFHINESIEFILECLLLMKKGEIFVPKMSLYRIKDLADKLSQKHKIIGLRKGEKVEEVLISEIEKKSAIERNDMWIIKADY